jgi:hypothetical protein
VRQSSSTTGLAGSAIEPAETLDNRSRVNSVEQTDDSSYQVIKRLRLSSLGIQPVLTSSEQAQGAMSMHIFVSVMEEIIRLLGQQLAEDLKERTEVIASMKSKEAVRLAFGVLSLISRSRQRVLLVPVFFRVFIAKAGLVTKLVAHRFVHE